jgi:very-short-patch-repair endonuclease
MRHEPPPINRGHARGMRKDPTRAEDMLWNALRHRRLEGPKSLLNILPVRADPVSSIRAPL